MRKGFVKRIWFRLAFVWPYRCDDCDLRFCGFRRSYAVADSQLVALCFGFHQHFRMSNPLKTHFDRLSAWLRDPSLTRTATSVSDRPSSLS